jgi:hypothetical protein
MATDSLWHAANSELRDLEDEYRAAREKAEEAQHAADEALSALQAVSYRLDSANKFIPWLKHCASLGNLMGVIRAAQGACRAPSGPRPTGPCPVCNHDETAVTNEQQKGPVSFADFFK